MPLRRFAIRKSAHGMQVTHPSPNDLSLLSEEQLRAMTSRLLGELRHSQALNAKLTQALGRINAIHDQRATPRGYQLDRESDPADCCWAK